MWRDLLRRSFWLAVGGAAGRLLPLTVLLWASRQMETRQFASASAAYAWAGVAMSLTSVGAMTVMTQRLGAATDSAHRAAIFARQGGQALSAAALLAAAVALFGAQAATRLFDAALDTAVVLPSAFVGALWSVLATCIAALNGCHRTRTASLLLATCGVLQGAGMGLALRHFGGNAQALAWGLALGCLLACGLAVLMIAHAMLLPSPRRGDAVPDLYPRTRWWHEPVLWNSLASAAALPVTFLAGGLVSRGPTGPQQLAQYFALEQIHQLVIYLPGIIGQALLPLLSRQLNVHERGAQRARTVRRIAWVALATCPLGLSLASLASIDVGWLVRLLANPAVSTADHWPVRCMLLNASMSLGLSITGGIFLASGRLVSAAILNLGWAAAFLGLTMALADHGNAGLQTARLAATVVLEIAATVVLLRWSAEPRAAERLPAIHGGSM